MAMGPTLTELQMAVASMAETIRTLQEEVALLKKERAADKAATAGGKDGTTLTPIHAAKGNGKAVVPASSVSVGDFNAFKEEVRATAATLARSIKETAQQVSKVAAEKAAAPVEVVMLAERAVGAKVDTRKSTDEKASAKTKIAGNKGDKVATPRILPPNFFLGVRVSGEAATALAQLQQALIAKFGNISPALIDPNKLHMTLMLARLPDGATVSAAREALISCDASVSLAGAASLRVAGLGFFSQGVVYAKVVMDEPAKRLDKWATDALLPAFTSKGLEARRDDTLHITLFKLGRSSKLAPNQLKQCLAEVAADVPLGAFPLVDVQLLAIGSSGPDGFYKSEGVLRLAPMPGPASVTPPPLEVMLKAASQTTVSVTVKAREGAKEGAKSTPAKEGVDNGVKEAKCWTFGKAAALTPSKIPMPSKSNGTTELGAARPEASGGCGLAAAEPWLLTRIRVVDASSVSLSIKVL